MFLDFRFYLARKTIEGEKDNAKIKGAVVPFQTKLEQVAQMLIGIGNHFAASPILVVTDSWFGNDSLWRPVRDALGGRFHMLFRLRCNNALYPVRRLIAEAALNEDFDRVCSKPGKPTKNSLVAVLLCMVAW